MYYEDEYYEDEWDDEDEWSFCPDCGEYECCCDEIERVGGFADRKPEDETITTERLLRDLDINYNLPGQLDDIPF